MRNIACAQAMRTRGNQGCFYDPEDPFGKERAELNDKKYAIDHYPIKLLKLAKSMNTETAKQEAERRHRFMLQVSLCISARDLTRPCAKLRGCIPVLEYNRLWINTFILINRINQRCLKVLGAMSKPVKIFLGSGRTFGFLSMRFAIISIISLMERILPPPASIQVHPIPCRSWTILFVQNPAHEWEFACIAHQKSSGQQENSESYPQVYESSLCVQEYVKLTVGHMVHWDARSRRVVHKFGFSLHLLFLERTYGVCLVQCTTVLDA